MATTTTTAGASTGIFRPLFILFTLTWLICGLFLVAVFGYVCARVRNSFCSGNISNEIVNNSTIITGGSQSKTNGEESQLNISPFHLSNRYQVCFCFAEANQI